MGEISLDKSLAAWIEATLNDPGDSGREHCFELRRRFRVPGAGKVDVLTVRHESGATDLFRVDLWTIVPRRIEEKDVDALMRRLHAFQAWTAELIEHAETQGFSPRHRIRLRGNLVGRSVRRSPFVDLLSHWGSSVFFWTWTRAGAGLDVQPAYGRAPSPKSARLQLKGLLDHLPWSDSVDPVPQPSRATRP